MNAHSSYELDDLQNNILPDDWKVIDKKYQSQIIFENNNNNKQIIIQQNRPTKILLIKLSDDEDIESFNITKNRTSEFSKLDDAIDRVIYHIRNSP